MTQFINFNTVIGNGKAYQVPLYQRDYSWEKDLWQDIEAIPQDKSHYLGYLVLQPLPDAAQSYLIIDGQQRIATLSLLSLAVAKLLKDWAEAGIDGRQLNPQISLSNDQRLSFSHRMVARHTSPPSTKNGEMGQKHLAK